MCAIFGSNKPERLKTLYALNKCRGDAAFGLISINTKCLTTLKRKGNPGSYSVPLNSRYWAAHTQAPTSCEQDFTSATSHPFRYKHWSVAHNGVLVNVKDLQDQLPLKSYNNVDTSLIPVLLAKYVTKHIDEVDGISIVLNMLIGTHTMWIYNTRTKNLYLTRCGSTLFLSPDRTEFSSVEIDNFIPIKDGSIYKLIDKRFECVKEFKANSPFLIL